MFSDYCTPALIYLGISFIAILLIVIQNILNTEENQLCIGVHKCTMTHKIFVFIFKIVYMLFWAWLLNFLCKKGLKKLAWFILLIPFLLIAVIIGSMILFINHNNAKTDNHNVEYNSQHK